MATINDLPNEILFKIFGQIAEKKPITRTCKRWNALMGSFLHLEIDVTLMEDLKQFFGTEFIRSYRKLTIVGVDLMRWDSYRNYCRLGCKRARLDDDDDPFVIIRKCLRLVRQCEPSLRELRLGFERWMDRSLMAFLPRCGEDSPLEKLCVQFSTSFQQHPDDWAINRIEAVAEEGLKEVSNMPKLTTLLYQDTRYRGDRTVRRRFFDTIVRKARAVTEIVLQCDKYACFSDFRIIRSFSQHLEQLSCMVWPIFAKDLFQLTLPNLKTLELEFSFHETTPDTVAHFFANACSLTDLTVTDAHHFEFFEQGVFRCAALERLIINRIGWTRSELAIHGVQNLDRLRELHLYHWPKLDDQNAVPCSHTLKKLVLDQCRMGVSFYSILANNAPHITELRVTGDIMLNDECLRIICTTLPDIRRLYLSLMVFANAPITDYGLRCVVNLRRLEYLYLECCDGAYYSPDTSRFRNLHFTGWLRQLASSEIHLKGFRKYCLHDLIEFMMSPHLMKLTLERCGKESGMIDGLAKIRQLIGDSRSLPSVTLIYE